MTLTTTAPRRLERHETTAAAAVYVGPGSDYRAPFLAGRWYVRIDGRPLPTLFPREHWNAKQVRDANEAVDLYREWVIGQPALVAQVRNLAGFDLSCRCEAGAPCHADVLLELANG